MHVTPYDFASVRITGGKTLFESWLDDFVLVAEAMIQ
jgi:hypothetical protein